VTELTLAGDGLVEAAFGALPDLYAGAPARIAARVRPEGGQLVVRGHTASGPWESHVEVAPCAAGVGSGAVVALYGRESVEGLEVDLAAGADRGEVDTAIERIGLDFQISTRLTSWVAISEESDVDPRKPLRRVRQLQQLPYGLSAEGLGLTPSGRLHSYRQREPAAMAMEDLGDLELGAMFDAFDAAGSEYQRLERPLGGPRLAGREAARRSPRVRLAARLVRRDDDVWVFEISVEAQDLEWRLPDRVEFSWREGPRLEVELLAEQSTAECRVPQGACLRLVVRCHPDVPHTVPDHLCLRSTLYGLRRIPVRD